MTQLYRDNAELVFTAWTFFAWSGMNPCCPAGSVVVNRCHKASCRKTRPRQLTNWLSRDRIVVSILRCSRSNPGSNPSHGSSRSRVVTFSLRIVPSLFHVNNNYCYFVIVFFCNSYETNRQYKNISYKLKPTHLFLCVQHSFSG